MHILLYMLRNPRGKCFIVRTIPVELLNRKMPNFLEMTWLVGVIDSETVSKKNIVSNNAPTLSERLVVHPSKVNDEELIIQNPRSTEIDLEDHFKQPLPQEEQPVVQQSQQKTIDTTLRRSTRSLEQRSQQFLLIM